MNLSFSKSKIFLYGCLSFIVGIAIASFFPVSILRYDLWWFAGVISCGVFIILFWQIKILKIIALAALFLFLAIWRYGISLPADDPDKVWHYNGQEVTAIGVVANEPDIREDKVKYEVEARELSSQKGSLAPSRRVSGKILITTNLYPRHKYGDELEIKCELKKPEKIEEFAYDRYLARYDIYSVCYWPEIISLKIPPTPLYTKGVITEFYKNIFYLKDKLRDIIDYGLPEPESSLAGPLILGGQRGMSLELKEDFSRTGLSHITAVSGMNVSMLAAMVALVLYNFSLKRKHIFLISSAFLVFYVILVGAPASAMRAGLMGFLVLWALHLGRLNKMTNALALAAAILLLVNPKLLRDDIGFQLSFLAILGLAYYYPLIDGWLQRRGISRLKGARDILAATLAAQIFTLPIIAFNFSKISLIAPLANLLVLWILPAATVAIIIALPLSFMLPGGAFLFFFPVWLFLKYIILVVEKLAKIPYAYVQVDYFPTVLFVLYYGIAAGWLIWRDKKR